MEEAREKVLQYLYSHTMRLSEGSAPPPILEGEEVYDVNRQYKEVENNTAWGKQFVADMVKAAQELEMGLDEFLAMGGA